jgi:putative transposase
MMNSQLSVRIRRVPLRGSGSRSRRLHVPGGIYFVRLRPRTEQVLFIEDRDYRHFEDRLQGAVRDHGWTLHAYCLMPREVELAVQVSNQPLWESIQLITGSYSRTLHERLGRGARLFAPRYRMLLIEPQVYLPQVVRHIHWSPVEQAGEPGIAAYPYSSHLAYTGEEPLAWVTMGVVLRMLEAKWQNWETAYEAYIAEGPDRDLAVKLDRGSRWDPRVLGSPAYVKSIGLDPPPSDDVSIDKIIDAVAATFAISLDEILTGSDSVYCCARAAIAYRAVKSDLASFKEIARFLGRSRPTLRDEVSRQVGDRGWIIVATCFCDWRVLSLTTKMGS